MSVAAPPKIGDRERLGATMVLSLLLHGLLILGVGFALESAAPVMPTLDVILTQAHNALTPAQADFLAEASNRGGGKDDVARRPRDSQAGLLPKPEAGVAPKELRAQAPRPAPPPSARVLSSTAGPTPIPVARESPATARRALPRGDKLVTEDLAMARLAAEIDASTRLYARRPTRKFVSASTREYAWAGYLRAWVDRVERVGNLNYPDEARRRHLGGTVVINVGIRRDGSIESTAIVRSSGLPLLDDAALRIARLAEPYPPLPRTREDPDILNVVRTWQFMPGGTMLDTNAGEAR
jgi:protein TonB